MNIIINQFAGIGDILFTIPIARYFIKKGHKVTYPTVFEGLDKHFPDITFKNKQDLDIDYDSKEFIVTKEDNLIIPMRWANEIAKVYYRACMLSKYMIVNLPFGLWRTLSWERDRKKEDRLFSEVLKIKEGERYRLINNIYMSDGSKKINVPMNHRIKNIHLKPIEGYTLLDWGKVIENASEIFIVNSAILVLMEILTLRCQQAHIFKRVPMEIDHYNYSYICSKNYVFEDNR